MTPDTGITLAYGLFLALMGGIQTTLLLVLTAGFWSSFRERRSVKPPFAAISWRPRALWHGLKSLVLVKRPMKMRYVHRMDRTPSSAECPVCGYAPGWKTHLSDSAAVALGVAVGMVTGMALGIVLFILFLPWVL